MPISYIEESFKETDRKDTLKPYFNQLQNCYQVTDDLSSWIRLNRIKIKYDNSSNENKIASYDSLFAHSFFREPVNEKEQFAVIKAYTLLAFYQKMSSHYHDAKIAYQRADTLMPQVSSSEQKHYQAKYCLIPLGNIYTRLGDYEKAIQTFIRAENIFEKNDGTKVDDFGRLYYNWGIVYDDLEEYDYLVKFHKEKLENKYLTKLYVSMLEFAIISAEFEDYRFKKVQSHSDLPISKNIFNYHNELVKLSQIEKYFIERKKTDLARSNNFLNGIYNLKAEINQEFNSKAEKEILNLRNKALSAVEAYKINNQNSREISKQHYTIGQTYLDFQELDYAKYHFHCGLETVLPDFNPIKNPLPNKRLFFNENAIFENLEGLAEVFTLQNSLDLALQAYELSFYVKLNLRSIYDFESSKLYLQQKAKEINSKAIRVAWQLYNKTNDKQYLQRAFKIAESSRALLLLEGIAKNQLIKKSENVDSIFAEQKATFKKPVAIAELQGHLKNDEVLIEYFYADSLLYVFKIGKNHTPEFYQLKPKFEQVNQLLHLLRSTEKFAEYTNLAYKVYNNIVAPLQISPDKKMIIVPDGNLSALPFEALITSMPNDKNSFKKLPYLIKDHSIAYQYSATIYSKLVNQFNKAKYNKVLAIAPVFENTTKALHYSLNEIVEIEEYFQTSAITQKAATKANIKDTLPYFNIMHFSTHANAGDRFDDLPKIELYNSELNLNEIYSQPLNANLTVLSACETNIGKYKSGEGVMSLSRAFAYAGCPSLVSTLWQVNEKSTKDIVVEFYKNLKKGLYKNEALQKAKLSYLQNTDDAHPYYWASLVAIGNMQPLNQKQQFSLLKYLWLLFPFCIGATILFRYRKSSFQS